MGFQGSFCAFAGWTTILFIGDMAYDRREPKTKWVPVFLVHAVLAFALLLSTLQGRDVEIVPIIGRAKPSIMRKQEALWRKCPCIKSQLSCILISMYFSLA